jgi:hypothetical protein
VDPGAIVTTAGRARWVAVGVAAIVAAAAPAAAQPRLPPAPPAYHGHGYVPPPYYPGWIYPTLGYRPIGQLEVLTLDGGAAREPEPDEPARRRRKKKRSAWYGYQTLIIDGVALMLLAGSDGGGHADGDGAWVASLGAFALGAPIVHFAHRNAGAGAGSLAMRAVPILLASTTCSDDGDRDSCAMFAALGVLSVLAAIPVDAAALAYERPPDDERGATRAAPSTVAPWLEPLRSQGGIRGTF